MIPDIGLRLQTMIRAMQDVVLPAIDKDDALAREQANIILGSLAIISDQIDFVMDELLVELRSETALLRTLLDAGEGGEHVQGALAAGARAIGAGEALSALAMPPQAEIKRIVADVQHASDAIVDAAHTDGSAAFRAGLKDQMIAHATAQILRWRVGNVRSGFETDPQSLPSLAEVLEIQRQAITPLA